MAEDDIVEAEIIDDDEVVDAEIITGAERQLDGLSLISFITALVVILYPFNAILATVLSLASRTTRRRTGRWGRGFARAAWIIAVAQLLLGALLVVAALLGPMIRAGERSEPIPTQTPVCASGVHDCELVRDGVDGAKTFGRTMQELWEGVAG